MVKKLSRLFFILLISSLTIMSSCANRDQGSLSYYGNGNDNNSGTGGGNGNNNGGGNGCCCCNENTTPTCESVITITDARGNPIPNAIVLVYGVESQAYVTNANGEILAEGLIDGDYIIKVDAIGYQENVSTFTVTDLACPTLTLIMDPTPLAPTCNVIITVKENVPPPDDLPILGATLVMNGHSYQTNSSGSVPLSNLVNGSYPYVLVKAGYHSITGTYTVTNSICPDLLLSPLCSYTNITFLVQYNGVPVVSRPVVVTLDYNGTNSIIYNYSTDGSGHVTIYNVPVGTYNHYTITY